MKPFSPLDDEVDEDGVATEPGYKAWKLAKIERAQAQAQNRANMIPAEQIWRELGFER